MNTRNVTFRLAASLSLLMVGCATAPPDNAMINEARASFKKIQNDPEVARSGDQQLRQAKDKLDLAESLLKDGEDRVQVDHAAYLANRHAQIASRRAKLARLQRQMELVEERRRKLMLEITTNKTSQARAEAETLRKRMK